MIGGLPGGRHTSLMVGGSYEGTPVVPLLLLLPWAVRGALASALIALRLALATVKDPPSHLLTQGMTLAMSRSSLVVHRLLHPSLWSRDSQVVPDRNALIMLASAMLGNALHSLVKHRMYSQRVSPSFYRWFLRSHGFPRRS
jgi:hypothetical protein